MGAYIGKPNKETTEEEGSNAYISYGASSMQGWRVTQEDAHVAILDFDKSLNSSSFFAVFDGHGGSEVAEFAAKHLPAWILNQPEFKEGNIEESLKKGFVSFDKHLTDPSVISELRKLADVEEDNDASDDEKMEAALLREEANMSLDEVIEGYRTKATSAKNDASKDVKNEKSDDASSSSSAQTSSKGDQKASDDPVAGSSGSNSNKSTPNSSDITAKSDGETSITKSEDGKVECNNSKDDDTAHLSASSSSEPVNSIPTSSPAAENGSSFKGKGKHKKPVVKRATRNKGVDLKRAYEQFLENFEVGNDEDDDDDSDDDSEDSLDPNSDKFALKADSDDSDESDDDGDDDEDDDDEDSDSGDEPDVRLSSGLEFPTEEPGQDSGCTAVVAVVLDDKLYVANAGDSRCVVSSDGKAIDMSIDHKPEDTIELERITKAGGKVTFEGRVNGGLNLSRALGDHVYKNNSDLPLEEQMISSLPDVKVIDLDPKIDFMVLACDGIWNSMSSQEVIDFVGERLKKQMKPAAICVELFHNCLAPDTAGDGTGCDNMTAIIVEFKPKAERKRKVIEPSTETNDKKSKTSEE